LNGDSSGDVRLDDGDIIIVPPYISLVDATGNVKRPMYYEMTSQETAADLIKYAGGFAADAYKDEITLTRKTGGYDKVFTLSSANLKNFILADGDNVTVRSGLDLYENRVEIQGAVYRPGYYEIGKDIKTVKDLIAKAGGLRDNVFMNRAVLTREKEDLTIENISLNLNSIISGASDVTLKKNDVLFIATNDVLNDLGNFAIYGNVVNPGSYKYADNTTIEDLIVRAGGLLGSASMAKVDVARRIVDPLSTESQSTIAETFTFNIKDGLIVDGNSSFVLKPYDQVYIRRSPGYIAQRDVFLEGEVVFPGSYTLTEKTERISDVVKRAGNLTPYAYAQGAKLIRMKTDEEIANQRKTLRIISENSNAQDSISTNVLNVDRTYAIGIELDKAIANPRSEYDLVLRQGDRLIIPEYDNTIKINGAVMYPNVVLYKEGENVSYYIDQAGGYNDLAQKKRAYVIHMNGTLAKAKGSNKEVIQPGSEIIVPSKEYKQKMSLAETISIGTSITSMASVVALLINALTK
jgi:protein involved in polysaccharide export with SLBB domain